MPSLHEHEEACVRAFGKPYTEVHLWLDEFFNILGPLYHRDVRHHDAGIVEARRLFGAEGAGAAALHIKQDYGGKIPTEREARGRKYFSQAG